MTNPPLTTSTGPNKIQHIIKPSKGWYSLGLEELWEYRDLLYFMVKRDLTARYRQTALGPIWIILNPLLSMLLYSIIFGLIAKLPSDGVAYPVFTYTALLPWSFFSDAISSGTNSLSSSMALISKVYFPRLIVPMSRIISSLVDLAISFVILLGMMLFYGIRPTWGIVFIPVLLLIAALTGLAVGLWFAGAVVKFRDFGNILGYIVRVWMYATPVVYSIDLVPEKWRTLYRFNPMTGVVEGFRWALLGTGQPPNWGIIGISSVVILVVLIGALYAFRRVERSIVDIA